MYEQICFINCKQNFWLHSENVRPRIVLTHYFCDSEKSQHENNINGYWIIMQKAFSMGKSEDDWVKQVILFSVVNKSKSL